MVDTETEEKERKRKYKFVFLTVVGEVKNPENIEGLYESVRSWGMEEEDYITFTYLMEVDEY